MDRSPLSIFLAFLIAFQSCLAGFAVCSNGGCCHAEEEAAHVEDEHEEVHDHSTLVTTSVPHRCHCTDQEIDRGDAFRGSRDEIQTPPPVSYPFAGPVHDYRPSINRSTQLMPPRTRSEAADLQRLAVVRATRLLL
ncbi:MAG: hypothetical protein KJO43_02785 [Phycisphaerae bacterium]|nr:hypothetical protein [Phycisphaerae bacterium]RZV40825.1 MAG: hypothetical protein EX269_17145 [Acidimicrobiales bacterium]